MSNAFIKIPRDFLDGDVWPQKEKYSKIDAFVFLTTRARYSKQAETAKGLPCEKGQIITTFRELAAEWRWSVITVERFLQKLRAMGFLEMESYKKATIISVNHVYDGTLSGTPNGTPNGTPKSAQTVVFPTLFGTPDGTPDGTPSDTLRARGNDILSLRCKKEKESMKESTEDIEAAKAAMSKNDAAATKPRSFREKVILYFNEKMKGKEICSIRSIENQRAKMLKARLESYGEDAIFEVIDKAAASSFLNGGGRQGFIATFDWLVRPNNFTKVLEGNYDDNALKKKVDVNDVNYGVQKYGEDPHRYDSTIERWNKNQ